MILLGFSTPYGDSKGKNKIKMARFYVIFNLYLHYYDGLTVFFCAKI